MSTSPSSAPSPSISKSEYYSSLPWFRRFLAMLNWRPVVDYELREIEFKQREIEYEQRRIWASPVFVDSCLGSLLINNTAF